MSYERQLKKIGVTPAKLALIGVLAIVLVIRVISLLPANTTTGPIAQQPIKRTPVETPAIKPMVTSLSKPNPTELPWPTVDLERTLASDPFAMPDWMAKEERVAEEADHAEALAELRKQGASIVVIGETQKSATVGAQKVRVGDTLEGFRISDITTQGILLDRLESP